MGVSYVVCTLPVVDKLGLESRPRGCDILRVQGKTIYVPVVLIGALLTCVTRT